MKKVLIVVSFLIFAGCATKEQPAPQTPPQIGKTIIHETRQDKDRSVSDMGDEDKTPLTAEQVKKGGLFILDAVLQGITMGVSSQW